VKTFFWTKHTFENNLFGRFFVPSLPPAPQKTVYGYGDWPKLCFFQTDFDEIELSKNQLWRHFRTSSLLRHQKRHQTNITRFYCFGPLPMKISGYASYWIWIIYIMFYDVSLSECSERRSVLVFIDQSDVDNSGRWFVEPLCVLIPVSVLSPISRTFTNGSRTFTNGFRLSAG